MAVAYVCLSSPDSLGQQNEWDMTRLAGLAGWRTDCIIRLNVRLYESGTIRARSALNSDPADLRATQSINNNAKFP